MVDAALVDMEGDEQPHTSPGVVAQPAAAFLVVAYRFVLVTTVSMSESGRKQRR